MLPTSVFTVILGTLLVPSLAQVSRPPVLFAEYPTVTTCGGTLTSNYSAITYKTAINVNPNERCVWTIRTPNVSRYTLQVLYLGLRLQAGQTGITASCVGPTGTNITNVSGAGVIQLPSTCNSLVITFFSGASVSSRGFTLWYKASKFISATTNSAESSSRPVVLHPQYPVVSTCGGILTSSLSAIAYKTETNVARNERCVWTISTPNAIGYTLNVVSLGLSLQTGQTGITASCVNRGNSSPTNAAITATGVISLPSTCHKLLITFYSGASVSSRGFIIWYKATTGSNGISTSSKDYIVSNSQEHIRYPADANSAYTNNEMSTFVFSTPSNLYSTSRKTLVIYVRDRLEGSTCADVLQLYRFRPASGWTYSQQICGNYEMIQWVDNDLMLVTFKSDTSVVNRGFHISRTTVPL
ncbi:Deleted in malignant brain tumors 1 protein [Orchesella cincta]|uniref:Deleted in malignant brain tumors 1 protein n=1 Tax=Orchesella cincta TaxID=48709 RepID=A0A1D2MAW9_ORCCI|nr:Deleted in malignant brain tumors 1 protein [Orchesella cincta]